jgi:hypothetical protein
MTHRAGFQRGRRLPRKVRDTPTFEAWLLRQVERDDPVGDLAKDYRDDRYDGKLTYTYLLVHGACDGAIEAFHRAKREFAEARHGEGAAISRAVSSGR